MPTTDMKRHCDVLLQAQWLLCQDETRSIIEDGAVAVADGKILAAGPAMELKPYFSSRHTIDLGKSLLLPGLVNAHTHSPMTVLRGLADDLPLKQWLETRIWPLEAKLTKDIVYLGSLLACAEMLRSGSTCFVDMYMHQRQTARAVEQSGIRAVLSEAILDFPTISYDTGEQALALNEELLQEFAGHDRITFASAPHTAYTSSKELLLKSYALAERYDTIWYTHCSETQTDTAQCLEKFESRPIRLLQDLGILTPRATLVHMVDLQDDEIEAVANAGAHVVLSPCSNLKLGSGIARVKEMLAAGIRPGLGTDGAASNNTLNMFNEMRICALLHKGVHQDPTILQAQQVLDMATVNAGPCLHLDGLGSIAPGSPADIIALDLAAPNMQPLHNPLSQVVYAATGMEVRMTMVQGRILYQDGKFHSLDYTALLDEFAQVREWAHRNLS